MTEENNIIKNLRYLRKLNKLSVSEFGQLINVSESTMDSYLKGKRNMNRDNQILLCEIFSITLDDLLNTDLEAANICEPISQYTEANKKNIIEEIQSNKHLSSFFILAEDKTIKDKEYLKQFNFLKNLISLKVPMGTEYNPCEIIDFFINYYEKTNKIASCINAATSIILFWVFITYSEIDSFSSFISYMKNIALKKENGLSDSQKEYLDEYYYLFFDLLSIINDSEKYKDLVTFYLAVKTYFNFTDRKLRKTLDSECRSYATLQLVELALIGNKYAKKIK